MIRASGVTDRGHHGPLGLSAPSTPGFTVLRSSFPSLRLERLSGKVSTSAHVEVPYEWIRRGGADLQLTISTHGASGSLLHQLTQSIAVPPPTPPGLPDTPAAAEPSPPCQD